MSAGGLERRRSVFFGRWHVGRLLDRALAANDNSSPLFYFADSYDGDLSNCTWVLGRLGAELEKRFGIAGEVLILFTPYEDLQRRTFNALTERLRHEVSQQQRETNGQVRFTPDSNLSLLYAPDPRAAEKIESWNAEGAGSLVVAVPSGSSDADSLRGRLIGSLFEVLSERDLYQGRSPVTGNSFFGREQTLRSLRSSFRDGHSVGLFGLRRSGKTSVIREFKRRYTNQGFGVVISDLEATGTLDELPAQISADLNSTLRTLKEGDSSVWIGSLEEQQPDSFSKLGTRIHKIAEKNSRYSFVFAFDEIESLVPLVWADPIRVRTFLGAMRRAAQSSSNVCLLLTGVTSRFFRESMLDQERRIENPMLGFVDESFLGPFDEYETANLIRKLGRGMMLAWDDDALEAVSVATGGFPFLVRDLASAARGIALDAERAIHVGNEIPVTAGVVERAFAEWRDSAAELWKEIVQTLEVHHDLMAEMVRSNSDEELAEWLQFGDDSDRAARSLNGLGLLTQVNSGWSLSNALRSLQMLGRSTTSDITQVRASIRQRHAKAADVRQLISEDEGSQLEFKSSARVNLHTGKPDDEMKRSFIKTVAAFLNSEGGVLVVGVTDDGEVCGVDNDIKATNRSRDRYMLYLNDSLRGTLGEPAVIGHVTIELVDVDAKVICVITTQPYPQGVWCDEEGSDTFYVRNGNQTVRLRNREVSGYLEARARSHS